MQIHQDKAAKIQDALMAAQRALAPKAAPEQRATALAAVIVAQSFVTFAKDQQANGGLIEVARNEYASDEVEIDDDASTSRAHDGSGVWVQAWVWITASEDDSDLAEAADGDTCDGCGRESLDCSHDPCADVIADRAA